MAWSYMIDELAGHNTDVLYLYMFTLLDFVLHLIFHSFIGFL